MFLFRSLRLDNNNKRIYCSNTLKNHTLIRIGYFTKQEIQHMNKKRTFISFDYDHDVDLKNLLAGQAKNEDSPFEITDLSIKEAISHDWKEHARRRIKGCDCVCVICGEFTDKANGVSAEVKIAQEEDVPYFLLWGRSDKKCKKPLAAYSSDKMYRWTWDNLKALFNGKR